MTDPRISSVIQALQQDDRVQVASIFGSVAQDRARPGSDLDIAVAGPRVLTVDERAELMLKLSRLAGREVDLVDLNDSAGPILQEALCRGRIVLRKDPEVLARILKRMWLDEADFMPLYRRILRERREEFLK
jgi:predicted nucleotidyltransferase